MKNKSWNETWTISKEFEISDQKVVTREHHKRVPHVRQDKKEQHMMKEGVPTNHLQTQTTFSRSMIKKLNKISKKLQQTSQDSSKKSSDFKKTSEISKADE